MSALISISAAGCGPAEVDADELGELAARLFAENGLLPNGLGSNGLNSNGLNSNGLNSNGLNSNGLNSNGLSALAFSSWFSSASFNNQDRVMQYLVDCALGSGDVVYVGARSFRGRNAVCSGAKAGNWGQACREAISACLLARVNPAGRSVTIAMRGGDLGPLLSAAPVGAELDFQASEGAYYGDVFSSPPKKYVCGDAQSSWAATNLGRSCARDAAGASACGFVYTGDCQKRCAWNTTTKTATHCWDPSWTRMLPVANVWVNDGVKHMGW